MNYIINGIVSFNSQIAVLKNIQTGDEVTLPLPACRLLQCILSANGEILTREWLIQTVWDSYGLQSSNNNLNNYLSLVRRTLLNLGCENIIQTISRVGVRVSEDAQIEIINEDTNGVTVIAEKSIPQRKIISIHKKPIFLTSVFILLLLSFYLLYVGRSAESGFFIGEAYNYKGCRIELLSKFDEGEKKHLNSFILNNVTKLGYACKKDNIVIFDSVQKKDNEDFNRIFLAICTNDGKGLKNCNSYNLIQDEFE